MIDTDGAGLSQEEADRLIRVEKRATEATVYHFPSLGGRLDIPLASVDGREMFSLDVNRGRIALRRETFQLRGRRVVVLVRLDLGGPAHLNPDLTEVPTPHLHVFREGFGTRWAVPLPDEDFPDVTDSRRVLTRFMEFCTITRMPHFEFGLFT